jgi:site-specific DNA recombinase
MTSLSTQRHQPTEERVEVLFYGRYSTDKQSEASIEDQLRECRRTCERLGLPAPSMLFEDRAKSGKSTTGRAGLERLLATAATPTPGVRRILVVEAIDRLGRNLFDGMDTVRRLHRDAGIRIVTADGRDSDNSVFKMALMADTMAADLYLDNLKLHTRRGLEGRVLSAGVWIGRSPAGYRIEKTTVDGATSGTGKHVIGGHLVVDEVGAAIVRQGFELAAEGLPLHAVARRMNKMGIASQRGAGWTGRTLRSILRKHRSPL